MCRSCPRLVRAPLAVFLLLATLVTCGAAPPASEDHAVEWLKREAHPFDSCEPGQRDADLAFLRGIVGDARIVALGEGTHGTHEFFQMKRRVVEYLATHMGFTLFAIEANMPEAYRVNDYVLTGRGDPKALLRGMYFWTWDTREVLDLIEWMRAFNQSGRGRIQFLGFDMQTPDTAAAIVERFVARAEPAYLDSVGRAYALVAAARPASARFTSATATFPAALAAGHTIRFGGSIRTADVPADGYAGLWWRADAGKRHGVAFDNMQRQGIRGTRPWRHYELTLAIPDSTTNVNFGCLLSGAGTAWFDSLTVEIDGRPYAGDTSLDLSMERSDHPVGFGTAWGAQSGYTIDFDSTTAVAGRRSLRLRKVGPVVPATGPSWTDAERAAGRVLAHLEAGRDGFVKTTGATDADWAIQNARVVSQMASTETSAITRDAAMADNVAWILEHAPRGARIALWAHNWHVSKAPGAMGSHLASRYGREMVVFGFAFHDGRYNAIAPKKLLQANDATPSAPGSLEWACHATGLPRFVVDLRRAAADPLMATWLADSPPMRSIGALAVEGGFSPTPVATRYDAIIYFDHTTPSALLR
jgi:erythromycin esterase-like protein